MIKRRFYQQDHGDGSDFSSSSSDEEERVEVGEQLEEEEEDEDDEEDNDEDKGTTLTTRGYVSEGSSPDNITMESSDEDYAGFGKRGPKVKMSSIKDKAEETRSEEPEQPPCGPGKSLEEDANCILKIKSVFKCRICPAVLCLSDTFLMAHLKSKKHAHSKKLLKEGRLKLTLNSDGELEEQQETHAERHARIVALAQKPTTPKNSEGRKRQTRRRKKKLEREAKRKKTEESKGEKPKCEQPKLDRRKTKQPKETSGKKNAY